MESPDTLSMHGVVAITQQDSFEQIVTDLVEANPEKVYLSVVQSPVTTAT
jgi:hypothetical protein